MGSEGTALHLPVLQKASKADFFMNMLLFYVCEGSQS